METYDKTGVGRSRHINNKNSGKTTWPLPGTSATDLFNTNYRIMVAPDLLKTSGFHLFYQEWSKNLHEDSLKRIFIPSVELRNADITVEYESIAILQHSGCDDLLSLFQYAKNMGTWLFLTRNDQNAESTIKIARDAGIYMRIYKLDQEGRLRNCRLSEHNTKTCEDAFALPNQITPFKKVVRRSQCASQIGGVVYTSEKQPVKLGEEFLSNPQSITYQTNLNGLQAKIYQPQWLTLSYFEDKAKRMLEKPVKCEGICWPIDLLYNAEGEFTGILIPKAEGYQLKQNLMSQQGLESTFPEWDRRSLTHLTKVILDKIVYLHDRNILFGLLNPSTILVKDENHVYFTEMDTYQIEGYPILSYERVMQAPELQDVEDEVRLYTKQQDYYEIALLVFMILMPGKFPYNKKKNKSISESVKNMSFAFRYGRPGEEHGAKEYFGLWRFAWSHLGNDLKQAFYYTFQSGQAFSIPEKRRDARFWQRKVGALEQELINPYDKESLKIFPRTFKRFSSTKTIHCVKCGVDHPDFYYRYPERKICNSCLGKPSQTHFDCKTCGKSFYYDFGTLFKYEELVKTKNFSMPTHCPYCRSDKRKCEGCGNWFPAYRLNDNGMCFDCAKIARERIVKRYYCSCGNEIALTQGQVDFYMKKFGDVPRRCEQCREKRRNRY